MDSFILKEFNKKRKATLDWPETLSWAKLRGRVGRKWPAGSFLPTVYLNPTLQHKSGGCNDKPASRRLCGKSFVAALRKRHDTF